MFTFERLGEDRVRTQCTVKADLTIARNYGIQIQELPLLCRGLLERREDGNETASLTFTEEDIRVYAKRARRCESTGRQQEKATTPACHRESRGGMAWSTTAMKTIQIKARTAPIGD